MIVPKTDVFTYHTSWQFGIPSVSKYLQKKTVMVKSTKVLEFVPSPAVTIIPPWKVEFKKGVDNIPAINCTNMYNTSEEVWNCILDLSYNVSEVILSETHPGTWRTELTDPHTGIYFSRNDLFNMSTSRKESYDIIINESICTSKIVLHDPDFFAINLNPVTIPKIIRQGEQGEAWFFQLYLELTEVSKMNLPDNPCEVSLSHSLTKCIKEFVIKVNAVQLLFYFTS